MDLSILPPLFGMDDYKSCMENKNNQYCSVQAKVDLSFQNSSVKEFIKTLNNNKTIFDRTIIHRAICIPKYVSGNKKDFHSYSDKVINQRIQDFNLIVAVDDSTCIENLTDVTSYDQTILFILLFYSSLVLFATYYGIINKNKTLSVFGNSLTNLSLINIWSQRTIRPSSIDYQKLLSMQGLRFFSLMILIYVHVMFMYNISYISNPSDYEEIYVHPENQLFATFALFIVLIFFLLSSWLLTIQVHNIFENHNELSLKHVSIMILNRYFRLAVTVAFSIVVMRTSLLRKLVGPTNFSVIVFNEKACEYNWLQAIFFVNNFYYIFDICNPVSWYLSADFQLYAINLFCLYLKLKYRIKEVQFHASIIIIPCILHGILLYMYEVDIMFRPYLRNLELRHFKNSTTYLISYMSTISIWSSSSVGVTMGTLYHNTKNNVYAKRRKLNILWALSFLGLPCVSVLICHIEVKGLLAAVLGSIVKPIYCFGIGLGIWGMSHNFGGIIKKILEYRYFILLSNFTFSVYLLHTGIINIIHSADFYPLVINDLLIEKDYLFSVVISFLLGIIVTLTVEEQGLMLQKKYLPQVNKWVQKSKKE